MLLHNYAFFQSAYQMVADQKSAHYAHIIIKLAQGIIIIR